jgi:hypothetical protein
MSYAKDTSVSVEKTGAELKSLLLRAGAQNYSYSESERGVIIMFRLKGRVIKFVLPLPDRNDKRFLVTPARRFKRTPQEAYVAWEQDCRSSWRALLLCVKADLEAVERNIRTFEVAFMAHFVVEDGKTFAQVALPQLTAHLEGKTEGPFLLDWKG